MKKKLLAGPKIVPVCVLLTAQAGATQTQAQSRFGRWLLKAYMHSVITLLTRFVSKQKDSATIWRYYWDSIEACVPPEQVAATLSAAGLTQVKRHVEVGVFSEYQARKA